MLEPREPIVIVKEADYLPDIGDLADEPLVKSDSELVKALVCVWKRLGKAKGVSAVMLQPSFTLIRYGSELDFKDIWITMVAIKYEGRVPVPYLIDFDIYGYAYEMGIWTPKIPQYEEIRKWHNVGATVAARYMARDRDLEASLVAGIRAAPELQVVYGDYLGAGLAT